MPPEDSNKQASNATSTDPVILAKYIAAELVKLWPKPDAAPQIQAASSDDAATNFLKIKQYLESVENRPSSTTQLRLETGISRGSLSNILYVTHKHLFDSIESAGHRRKKLWFLRRAEEPQDMAELPAHECCRRILLEHGNEPMHPLTLARIAISRGYAGRGTSTGDELLWITAKSFWARLSRANKHDFETVGPNLFRVAGSALERGPQSLFAAEEES